MPRILSGIQSLGVINQKSMNQKTCKVVDDDANYYYFYLLASGFIYIYSLCAIYIVLQAVKLMCRIHQYIHIKLHKIKKKMT